MPDNQPGMFSSDRLGATSGPAVDEAYNRELEAARQRGYGGGVWGLQEDARRTPQNYRPDGTYMLSPGNSVAYGTDVIGAEAGTVDPNNPFAAQVEQQTRNALSQRVGADPRSVAVGTDPNAARGMQQHAFGAVDAQTQFERRGQQMLAADLRQQALGQGGPTAAQGMLQQAADRNIAGQLAAAASGRGGNLGGALAGAQTQAADIGLQAGQQAATLRAQEQQSAQQLMGDVLSASRGLGVQGASAQGNIANQVRSGDVAAYGAQTDALLGGRQLDDAAFSEAVQNQLRVAELRQAGQQTLGNYIRQGEQQANMSQVANRQMRLGKGQADRDFYLNVAGTALDAGASGAAVATGKPPRA